MNAAIKLGIIGIYLVSDEGDCGVVAIESWCPTLGAPIAMNLVIHCAKG